MTGLTSIPAVSPLGVAAGALDPGEVAGPRSERRASWKGRIWDQR
jgi:hypothetical protein